MKITYFANIRLPTERAHGLQIMKMCEALAAASAAVELCLPERRNHIESDPFVYYQVRSNFRLCRLPAFDFRLWTAAGRAKFWLQEFSFIIQALVHLWRQPPDAVYSRDLVLGYVCSWIHPNVCFEDHEPPRSHRWLYRYFLRRLPKKVIVPEQLAELYRQFKVPEASFRVLPNGVDLAELDRVPRRRAIWSAFGLESAT